MITIDDFTVEEKQHFLTHDMLPIDYDEETKLFTLVCIGCGKVADFPASLVIYYIEEKFKGCAEQPQILNEIKDILNGKI